MTQNNKMETSLFRQKSTFIIFILSAVYTQSQHSPECYETGFTLCV